MNRFANLSIRQLTWEFNQSGGAAAVNIPAALGSIFIVRRDAFEKPFRLAFDSRILGCFRDDYTTLDEAKEAAQTLFEQSIADTFFESEELRSDITNIYTSS